MKSKHQYTQFDDGHRSSDLVLRRGAEGHECVPDGCFDPYATTAKPEGCNHFGDDFVICA
jgi:hypothetical protein